MRIGLFMVSFFIVNLAVAAETHQSTIINNEGEIIGDVVLTQGTQGIIIRVKAEDLTPGAHGMHFHEVGTCADTHTFKLSKGHINPHNKPHGFLNQNGPHEGNLPNLIVGGDGTAHVELYSSLVNLTSLLAGDGSALIIHTNEDDHITQPIGGAGARVACAVIHTNPQAE